MTLERDILRAPVTRRRFIAGVLATGLLIACGGDDDDDAGTPTAAPAQGTPTGGSGAGDATATTGESPDATPTGGAAAEPTATAASAGESPTTAAPVTDAELIVGHNLDPTTLNPLETTSAAFQTVFAQILEQFVIFDSSGASVEPWLAETFEWVDPQTLELVLKSDVTFTNGEPLNADCVKFVLDQYTASPRYQFFVPADVYKETEAVDETTARVHLNRPFAPFLGFMARSVCALPPAYYQEVGPEAFGQEPIGTGPFILEEWVKDDHITLVRNEEYWGGPHPIATVTYRVIPEPTARVAAFETGEIDIAMYMTVDAIARFENAEVGDAIVANGLRKYATHFDTKAADAATLGDVRVRTALNHAVDKQAIAESVFQGTADPLQGQWMVSSEFGFNPDIPEFEYDPEKAKQLIAEAGFPDGFELQLSYTAGNTPLEKELGEIVASFMEQVGVKVTQRYMEYGAFLEQRTANALGTHQWGLLLPPEPHFNFALFTEGTIYQFHRLDPHYDELVLEGTKTTDEAERTAIYHEAGQMMHDDPPMLFLVVPRDIYGVNKRVKGFEARTDQVLWLFDVHIEE